MWQRARNHMYGLMMRPRDLRRIASAGEEVYLPVPGCIVYVYVHMQYQLN